jgi:hypothetical protein
MALSLQLRDFCESWQRKAAAYALDDLGQAFDRFFTSYVIFNRLYAEATYRLARGGHVRLRDSFPDAQAAKSHVAQYCTAEVLIRGWNENAAGAIQEITDHLRDGRFALKLDPVTGNRRPDKDDELRNALQSRGSGQRAKGVLEALYAIRCNMFHGQKRFEVAQLELLRPATRLLESTINTLFNTLDQRQD